MRADIMESARPGVVLVGLTPGLEMLARTICAGVADVQAHQFAPASPIGMDCFIVAQLTATGAAPALELSRGARVSPSRVILLSDLSALRSNGLSAAVLGGVAQLILVDSEPVDVLLRAHLLDRTRSGALAAAAKALLAILPPALQWIVQSLIETPFGPAPVARIASELACSRWTLRRRANAARLGLLVRVLEMAQLTVAHHYLEYAGCTRRQAAQLVGFRDPRALARLGNTSARTYSTMTDTRLERLLKGVSVDAAKVCRDVGSKASSGGANSTNHALGSWRYSAGDDIRLLLFEG